MSAYLVTLGQMDMWNDGPKILKAQANFGHKVWDEASCSP